MSVIMETTLGDLIFDLYTEQRPSSSKNFLKLCKMKYYNYCLFHSVRRNFIAQSGDPTGTGKGGESVYGLSYGDQAKYFALELKPRIKHRTKGTISFVNNGNDMHGSQFFITLGDGLDFLDGKHTVFGQLAEGFDILEKLNETICDEAHRPYKDIRITHTIILEDPFDDLKGLKIPSRSPEPTKEQLDSGRIGADEAVDDSGKTREEIDKEIEDKDLKIGTKILETIGDIPDAELKPPENVLFVCKLNPVTNADDLKIIFSRFGKIESCEIIKDQKTDDSLGYGFIEFDKVKDCEKAYFKMDNVLIDDRRIHVDFCQSISKLKWKKSANYKKIITEKGLRKDGIGYKPRKVDSKQQDKYELLFEEVEREQSKKRKTAEKRHETLPKADDRASSKKKKTKKARDDSDDDEGLSFSEDDYKKRSKKDKKGEDRKDSKKRLDRSLSPGRDSVKKTSSKKQPVETKGRTALSDSEASDYNDRKTTLSGRDKKPVVNAKRKPTTLDTDSSDSELDEKKLTKSSKKTWKPSRRSPIGLDADEKLMKEREKSSRKPRQLSPLLSSGSESETETKRVHRKRMDPSDHEGVSRKNEKPSNDRATDRKRKHDTDSEFESKTKASHKTDTKKSHRDSRSHSPHEKTKLKSLKKGVEKSSSSEDSSDEDERHVKKLNKNTKHTESTSKHSHHKNKGSEKVKHRRTSFRSDLSSD